MSLGQDKLKGFSLLELIIVCIIIAIFATLALPGYHNYKNKLRGKSAQANLTAIFHAQKRYKLDNDSGYFYCTAGANNSCRADLSDLNAGLGLDIFDPYFSYSVGPRVSGGFIAKAFWKGASINGCPASKVQTYITNADTMMMTNCSIWVSSDCNLVP